MWVVLSRFIRLTKKWSNFIDRLGKSHCIWNHWKQQNDKTMTTFSKNQSLQQAKPRLQRLVFIISPCLSRHQQGHNSVYNNLGALHSKIVVSITTLMTIFFKIISLIQLVNFSKLVQHGLFLPWNTAQHNSWISIAIDYTTLDAITILCKPFQGGWRNGLWILIR